MFEATMNHAYPSGFQLSDEEAGGDAIAPAVKRRDFFFSILAVFAAAAGVCNGQVYPSWFLEPVNPGETASGYTQNFFLQSSSDSAAYLKACENLARQHYTEFRGGEAFWQTEAGVYWMGDNFSEELDSSYLGDLLSHAKKVAEYSNKDLTFVLVSKGDLTILDSMNSAVECSLKEPPWVEALPEDNSYVYAEGVAPKYFYESSSWDAAENKARFNLARNVKVKLETMQKVEDQSGQEIRNEEVSEMLHDIEVVHRWQDSTRGLFYVLVRMLNR